MKGLKSSSIIILLAICLVGSVFLYVYLFSKIEKTNMGVISILNSIDLELNRDARARNAKHVLNELSSERVAIKSYFIDPDSVVIFLETIEGLGSIAGAEVEVNSVNIVDGLEEDSFNEILEINFAASGSWKEIYHLLSFVEALPYAVKFNRVHIETTGGQAANDSWQGNFSFNVAKLK